MAGILDNKDIKIDIVYTKLGRYYKSINSPLAEIVKYSLGDDGIDYNLYDQDATKETAIQKMTEIPLINTSTYNRGIKYKLVSLPFDTEMIPTFQLSDNQVNFEVVGNRTERIVQTINVNVNFNSKNGFKVFFEQNNDFLTINLPNEPEDQLDPSTRSAEGVFDATSRTADNVVSRSIKDEVLVDTKYLKGSASSPSTLTFDIIYDSKLRRFVSDNTINSQIIIESNDLGIRKTLDTTIKKQ